MSAPEITFDENSPPLDDDIKHELRNVMAVYMGTLVGTESTIQDKEALYEKALYDLRIAILKALVNKTNSERVFEFLKELETPINNSDEILKAVINEAVDIKNSGSMPFEIDVWSYKSYFPYGFIGIYTSSTTENASKEKVKNDFWQNLSHNILSHKTSEAFEILSKYFDKKIAVHLVQAAAHNAGLIKTFYRNNDEACKVVEDLILADSNSPEELLSQLETAANVFKELVISNNEPVQSAIEDLQDCIAKLLETGEKPEIINNFLKEAFEGTNCLSILQHANQTPVTLPEETKQQIRDGVIEINSSPFSPKEPETYN